MRRFTGFDLLFLATLGAFLQGCNADALCKGKVEYDSRQRWSSAVFGRVWCEVSD